MYPQYLYKNSSNTSYFFGSCIPLDLRHLYQGRKLFRISLKCGNKVISKKICLHLNIQIENLYEQIRMDKIHKYVSDLTSFDEGQSYFSRMKKHSSRRFKEITERLREEGKKRKEKKEQRKELVARG